MTETIILGQQGVSLTDAVTSVEDILNQPLPEELTEHEAELEERRRIVEENRAAHERLVGIMGLPTS